MKSFTTHQGLTAPMDRANVDTDLIIPKQFLKSIKRSGFGANLFDELRYLDRGEPDKDNTTRPLNPDFPLNFPRYQGATILLGRENFGCGSSREHAPWALEEYGFRAIIAPSFADIFYNNCFKNGLLPIVLPSDIVEQLFGEMYAKEGYSLEIDLGQQQVTTSSGERFSFDVDAFRKQCLLEGLDEIALSLRDTNTIQQYEAQRKSMRPWLFNAFSSQ